jgi:hypothetical protein
VISIAGVLAGLKIGATIAGWAALAGPAITAISAAFSGLLAFLTGTLLPGLLAFFSGPVGWTVLAVAAVVAMVIAFRQPLGDFLNWLWNWGEPIRQFWAGLWNGVVTIASTSFNAIGGILQAAGKAWAAILYQALVQPWVNIWNVVLRKPVTTMIGWLQTTWKGITKFFGDAVVTPISKAWTALNELLPNAMKRTAEFVESVWTAMIGSVKNVMRSMLNFVVSGINKAVDAINYLIDGYNSIPVLPDIPRLQYVQIPFFAEGGYVGQGTLAVVGEAGPEYIVPEGKAAAFASNYLSGARGAAAIPAFADGGFVGATRSGAGASSSASRGGGSTGKAQISITTGPVLQQGGEQYVTLYDLERAMQMTADGVYKSLRTSAGRYATGVG